MRITEVVTAALDGLERVVDLHEGDLDLKVLLALPTTVEYARDDDALVDDHTLVVDLLGADGRRHRPVDCVTDTVAALRIAPRAMLLLAFDEPPLEQLLAASIDARAYVALAAPVDERDVDA